MSAVISSIHFRTQPASRVPAKSIALPVEHGAWGFLFEPLVAGLVLAPSLGAPWIALMVIGAFLMRQPLKFLIADWQQGRRLPRTRVALRFTLIYSTTASLGLAGSIFFSPLEAFIPFVALMPFVLYLLACDIARNSRQLLPEIIGAVALSSSVAALALAADWSIPTALALWAVFLARLIPSILYVRCRLRLAKGKDASQAAAIGAHYAALGTAAALTYYGLLPVLPILMLVILLGRSVYGLSTFCPPARAKRIGVLEVVYGSLMTLSIILGYSLKL